MYQDVKSANLLLVLRYQIQDPLGVIPQSAAFPLPAVPLRRDRGKASPTSGSAECEGGHFLGGGHPTVFTFYPHTSTSWLDADALPAGAATMATVRPECDIL